MFAHRRRPVRLSFTLLHLHRPLMSPVARSAAASAEPPDAVDDDTGDSPDGSDDNLDGSEEKLRSGIQSIEVGFRLLDVLTHEPRAMMLRDLAKRADMSPA